MAIGINSSFNEPEWDTVGLISRGRQIEREEIIEELIEFEPMLNMQFGEVGADVLRMIISELKR